MEVVERPGQAGPHEFGDKELHARVERVTAAAHQFTAHLVDKHRDLAAEQ